MENEEGKKYHLLPANLRDYSFNELLAEAETGVIWRISSKNRKRVHKICAGDVCFIYYTNLPDQVSRIIFRAKVIESDYEKGPNEKLIYDDKEGIMGIKLELKGISLEDNKKYCKETLRKSGFNENYNFQGYTDLNKPQYEELLKNLEMDSKKGYSQLKTVVDYFNEKYCLCDLTEYDKKRKHETFIEANGFNYIEYHHLVERHNINKNQHKIKNIEIIIDNSLNLFSLCPNCHKEIHYGKKERKREMIKYLYNKDVDKKKYLDDNFNEIKNKKDTLSWLYELYKIDIE